MAKRKSSRFKHSVEAERAAPDPGQPHRADLLVRDRRVETLRCPSHGLPLVPLEVDGEDQRHECPDPWCDYAKMYRR